MNQYSGKIQMVDLYAQHKKLEPQILKSFQQVILSSAFIKGKEVYEFEQKLAGYLQVNEVISCANGTDALQIALMALDLKQGDEVIVPGFTYVATAEVIALLGLVPVMVDVEEETFNISVREVAKAITSRTKAIIPVHLFGQSCDMEPLMDLAASHNLWVIEDNAQSLGATYTFGNGSIRKTGTIGHIGCTSFFPTKNLGCMGDGGAIMTNDNILAEKMRMIANHGQQKKYYHKILGCNSRLDTLQATVLNHKLALLEGYLDARYKVASFYQNALINLSSAFLPVALPKSKHTYNQYTLKVTEGKRDEFQHYLSELGIPTMIYYPLPLYKQEAFCKFVCSDFTLPVTEKLCKSVLSIPVHTEMKNEELVFITEAILNFKP